MEMPYEGEIEFELFCSECNEILEAEFYNGDVIVDPCEKCLENAREEAKNENSKMD